MKKVMLLGSGELGRELAISLKRLGCKVIACDRYENAPAMQVADGSLVFNMLNTEQLRAHIQSVDPDLIVPEIEAINTAVLLDLELGIPTLLSNLDPRPRFCRAADRRVAVSVSELLQLRVYRLRRISST